MPILKKEGEVITAERLRQLLSYDPATGIFKWRARRRGHTKVGDTAGSLHNFGYWKIKLDGQAYLAHRLAWLYVNGVFPVDDTDHINGNRTDNRIANLRDISRQQNLQNQRRAKRTNKSGFLGVSPSGSGWVAQISVGENHRWLGTFETPALASEAYVAAKRELHPGCTI